MCFFLSPVCPAGNDGVPFIVGPCFGRGGFNSFRTGRSIELERRQRCRWRMSWSDALGAASRLDFRLRRGDHLRSPAGNGYLVRIQSVFSATCVRLCTRRQSVRRWFEFRSVVATRQGCSRLIAIAFGKDGYRRTNGVRWLDRFIGRSFVRSDERSLWWDRSKHGPCWDWMQTSLSKLRRRCFFTM